MFIDSYPSQSSSPKGPKITFLGNSDSRTFCEVFHSRADRRYSRRRGIVGSLFWSLALLFQKPHRIPESAPLESPPKRMGAHP